MREVVLVVAADAGFRKSLGFALEADGYAVLAGSRWKELLTNPRAEEALCVVVDDEAVRDWPAFASQCSLLGKPTIVLLSRPRPLPGLLTLTVIMKPFLGSPLLEAVRKAVRT